MFCYIHVQDSITSHCSGQTSTFRPHATTQKPALETFWSIPPFLSVVKSCKKLKSCLLHTSLSVNVTAQTLSQNDYRIFPNLILGADEASILKHSSIFNILHNYHDGKWKDFCAVHGFRCHEYFPRRGLLKLQWASEPLAGVLLKQIAGSPRPHSPSLSIWTGPQNSDFPRDPWWWACCRSETILWYDFSRTIKFKVNLPC